MSVTIDTPFGAVTIEDPVCSPYQAAMTWHVRCDAWSPRQYVCSSTSTDLDVVRAGERIDDLRAQHLLTATFSLLDRMERDWKAEVPDEPVIFGVGAGISREASMFYSARKNR